MPDAPAGLRIIDMGVHVLPKLPGSHSFLQVIIPALEERAQAPMELKSIALQPGVFTGEDHRTSKISIDE